MLGGVENLRLGVTWMAKPVENTSTGVGKYASAASKSEGPHGVEAFMMVDSALLQAALGAVLAVGDAVLLGTTRDGGAVAMQMYSGDNVDKLYGTSLDDLTGLFQGILEASATT